MPAGVLTTVPEPLPALVTFRLNFATSLKVAITALAAVIVTTHSFEPLTESQPDQATACEPAFGVPFSVTTLPFSYLCSHSVPQLMPVGLLTTTPEPEPWPVTVRRNSSGPPPLTTTLCSTTSGLP